MNYSMDAGQIRKLLFMLVCLVATLAIEIVIFPAMHSLGFLAPLFFKAEQIVIEPAVVLCYVCREPGPTQTTSYGVKGGSGRAITSLKHHSNCRPPATVTPGELQPMKPGVYEYHRTDEKRGFVFSLFFAAIYTTPFAVVFFFVVLKRLDFTLAPSSGIRPAIHLETTRYFEHMTDLAYQVALNTWRSIKQWLPSNSKSRSSEPHVTMVVSSCISILTRTSNFVRLGTTSLLTNPNVWTRNVALGTFLTLSYIATVITHRVI